MYMYTAVDLLLFKRGSARGFVSIFLDDIILWSTDPETHKKNLLHLFEVLSIEKLSLNMNKCYFFARYVKYLGIIVGQGQMFMNTESVRSIINMPEPSDSQANIRIFLGMTGFYILPTRQVSA